MRKRSAGEQRKPRYIFKGGHIPSKSMDTLAPPPTGPAPGAFVPPEVPEEPNPAD